MKDPHNNNSKHKPHLRINPRFLFRLFYNISRQRISDQERRFWIMLLHVAQHNIFLRICIAIAAEVAAGIICAYVSREIAGAFFSVPRVWRYIEVLAYGYFPFRRNSLAFSAKKVSKLPCIEPVQRLRSGLTTSIRAAECSLIRTTNGSVWGI